MATKHLVSPGIGFTPGSVKYIVTRGLFPSGAVAAIVARGKVAYAGFRDKRAIVEFRDKRAYAEFRDKRAVVKR